MRLRHTTARCAYIYWHVTDLSHISTQFSSSCFVQNFSPWISLSIFLRYRPPKSTALRRNPAETSGDDVAQPSGKVCLWTYFVLSFGIRNCELQVISKVEICALTSDCFLTQMVNTMATVLFFKFYSLMVTDTTA